MEAQCGSDRPAFCLVDGVTEKEAFHFYNAMGLSKQHGSLATLLARINSAELALKFCQHVFENTSQVLSQPGEREGGSLPGSIRKSTVIIFQPAIFMGALFASGREYYRDDRKRLCLNGMDGFMEHRGFGQHPREFPGLLIGTPTQFYSNATLNNLKGFYEYLGCIENGQPEAEFQLNRGFDASML